MNSSADMFSQSLVDMIRADKDLQHSKESLAQVEKLCSTVEKLNESVAANLSEKYALRQQLALYVPNHPLLKNAQLVETVRSLGVRAFAINHNFDDARSAGETYFKGKKAA